MINVVPEEESTNGSLCDSRLSSSPNSVLNGENYSQRQNELNKTTEKAKSYASNNLKEKKDKLKTGLIKACFGWPKKKHGSDNDTLKRYSKCM